MRYDSNRSESRIKSNIEFENKMPNKMIIIFCVFFGFYINK